MNQTKLLLVDDLPRAGRPDGAVSEWLSGHGLSVVNVTNLDDAIEALFDFTTGACADVVMLPITMSTSSVFGVRDAIRLSCDGQSVEVVTVSPSKRETYDQLEKIFGSGTPAQTFVRTRSDVRAV